MNGFSQPQSGSFTWKSKYASGAESPAKNRTRSVPPPSGGAEDSGVKASRMAVMTAFTMHSAPSSSTASPHCRGRRHGPGVHGGQPEVDLGDPRLTGGV